MPPEILSDEDFEARATDLRLVKTMLEALEDERSTITAPLREALDATNAHFSPAKTGLLAREREIKGQVTKYLAARDAAAAKEMEAPTSHTALEKALASSIPQGIQDRTGYDIEVVNVNELPSEFVIKSPNKVALRSFVTATQGEKPIPGVKITRKRIIAAGTFK